MIEREERTGQFCDCTYYSTKCIGVGNNRKFSNVTARARRQTNKKRRQLLNKSSSSPVHYEVGLRTSSLNRSVKNKGTFDLLFILCSDGTCYSIPHGELPQTGTSLGPKYKEFQLRD